MEEIVPNVFIDKETMWDLCQLGLNSMYTIEDEYLQFILTSYNLLELTPSGALFPTPNLARVCKLK
jgi:hypothetical protein